MFSGVPDSEEIKRKMAELQKDLAKTEEALARLRKKIADTVPEKPDGKNPKKKNDG